MFTGCSKNRHKKTSKMSYKRLANGSQNNNSCPNWSNTCFLVVCPQTIVVSPAERWHCVLAFKNRDQTFSKKGPSDLYVHSNSCFTRRACVKERAKYVAEWWEMCYMWESDIQTCEIRFREIALSKKLVTIRTFSHRDVTGQIRKISIARLCVAICMQSFTFRLKFVSFNAFVRGSLLICWVRVSIMYLWETVTYHF